VDRDSEVPAAEVDRARPCSGLAIDRQMAQALTFSGLLSVSDITAPKSGRRQLLSGGARPGTTSCMSPFEGPVERLRNRARRGDQDQRGILNLIGPEVLMRGLSDWGTMACECQHRADARLPLRISQFPRAENVLPPM